MSMPTRLWRGRQLSTLMLGTVQFGVPYGVANRSGQPDLATVREMVATALAGGVNCLDTAAAYGTSEAVLGQVLHDLKAADQVLVVTKVKTFADELYRDPAKARQAIEESVAESRRRLRLDRLPLVLFHREADAVHLDTLLALRERGWLDQVGVSAENSAAGAEGLVKDPRVSALQLPANLLDRRHLSSSTLSQAQARGVGVFIRSAYLQGLLVMPEAQIPAKLAGILPARQHYQRLADQLGLSLAELAVRYLLSLPGITSVLTGVETLAQVRENLALFARGPLSAEALVLVNQAPPQPAEALITPHRWTSL